MTTYTVQKNEHKFKPGIFKMQTKAERAKTRLSLH
jgi:hypothetical protein